MSKPVGFFKKDGKTRPRMERKKGSDYNGQTNDPSWKESSVQDLKIDQKKGYVYAFHKANNRKSAKSIAKQLRQTKGTPYNHHAEVIQRGDKFLVLETVMAKKKGSDRAQDYTPIYQRWDEGEEAKFAIWWYERQRVKPIPSNPRQAYAIDKSLKAKLKTKHEWRKQANRSDWLPIDFPPTARPGLPRPRFEPSRKPVPSTAEQKKVLRKTRKTLRERAKLMAEKMNIPPLKIKFKQTPASSSFYSSGYSINRLTKEVKKFRDPSITVAIGQSGKLSPMMLGALAHEMGHHKTLVEIERSKGLPGVSVYYRKLRSNKKSQQASERLAWKHADPFLTDRRAVQKWFKKYAFGTYLGTSPPVAKPSIIQQRKSKV